MNSLYIGIGSALIAALLAALIGPFFVDWNAHRPWFQAQATRMIGLPVTVLGDVDARLLPSPRIRLGDVVVGDLAHPLARIGRFDLDLDPIPLLQGEIRLTEIGLDRPALDLAVGPDGRIAGFARADVHQAAIERIEITDGRATLTDTASGAVLSLDRLAGRGSAAGLAGPWKLDGRASHAGRPWTYRLAASFGSDDQRLRLALAGEDEPVTATLDLRRAASDTRLTGGFTLERRLLGTAAPRAFRFAGALEGDGRGLDLHDVTLSLGPEEREARLTGSARLVLGPTPRLDATLATRQIDLDHLTAPVAAPPPRADAPAVSPPTLPPATPADLLADLARTLTPWLDRLPAGRLDLEAQTLTLGGAPLQEVALTIAPRPGGLAVERFALRAPGRTTVTASGRLDVGERPGFAGTVDVAADEPDALAAWWSARPAEADPLDPVRFAGALTLFPDDWRGENLRLALGRTEARGWFDWSATKGPRLGLKTDRLDLGRLVALARRFGARTPAGLGAVPSLDLDLDVAALALPGTTATDVGLTAHVARDRLAVSRLRVGDVAGARLSGSGEITDPLGRADGSVDLALKAADPAPAVRALATLFAAPEKVETAARLATLAAPLDLRLRLTGRGGETVDPLTGVTGGDVALSVAGQTAGLPLALDLRLVGRLDDWRAATWSGSGRLGDDPGHSGTRPTLRLSLDGRPAKNLDLTARLQAPGGNFDLAGRAALPADAEPSVDLRVDLASADAGTLAALAGRPLTAVVRRLPLALHARVSGTPGRLAVEDLVADLANVRSTGRLAVDLAATPPRIGGKLDVDRLSLAALSDLLLGGGDVGLEPADGRWSSAPLGTPPFADRLSADLDLVIAHLDLGDDVALARVAGHLVHGVAETRLDHVTAVAADGRLTLDARITRSPDAVTTLSTRLAAEALDLAALAPKGFAGRLSGEAAIDARGRSLAALVAGSHGQGRIVTEALRLPGLAVSAFAAVSAPDASLDETALAARFASAVAEGEAAVGRLELPLVLDAGVVSFARTAIAPPDAKLTLRGSLDLAGATLEATGAFEPDGAAAAALESALTHARPSVGLRLAGPLDRPTLAWDTRTLATQILLARTEADIRRAEQLQQEIDARRARAVAPAPDPASDPSATPPKPEETKPDTAASAPAPPAAPAAAPAANRPESAAPTRANPPPAKPEAAKSLGMKPEIQKPDAARPEPAKPEASRPKPAEPDAPRGEPRASVTIPATTGSTIATPAAPIPAPTTPASMAPSLAPMRLDPTAAPR